MKLKNAKSNKLGSAHSIEGNINTNRFQSALNTDRDGLFHEHAMEWKAPLRRFLNQNEEIESITIRVRILSGDSEHDFQARFLPGHHTGEGICAAIAQKERMNPQEAALFALWVVSKDLELQVRPKQDIYEVVKTWNKKVLKYTHYPEAEDPRHQVNHHFFVYRREAALPLSKELSVSSQEAERILFGLVRWDYLHKRYPVTVLEATTVAAILLQITFGNYNPEKNKPGYLMNEEKQATILPKYMIGKLKPKEWEMAISKHYEGLSGLDRRDAIKLLLQTFRNYTCYGASFFPVCAEMPPQGFFEYRTQNWFMGVNTRGICVIDHNNMRYVHKFEWETTRFQAGRDVFVIEEFVNGKVKEFLFYCPQSFIIENLSVRCKYVWAKETGKWKADKPTKIAIQIDKDPAETPKSNRMSKLDDGSSPIKREGEPATPQSKHLSMVNNRQSRLLSNAAGLKSPMLRTESEAPSSMMRQDSGSSKSSQPSEHRSSVSENHEAKVASGTSSIRTSLLAPSNQIRRPSALTKQASIASTPDSPLATPHRRKASMIDASETPTRQRMASIVPEENSPRTTRSGRRPSIAQPSDYKTERRASLATQGADQAYVNMFDAVGETPEAHIQMAELPAPMARRLSKASAHTNQLSIETRQDSILEDEEMETVTKPSPSIHAVLKARTLSVKKREELANKGSPQLSKRDESSRMQNALHALSESTSLELVKSKDAISPEQPSNAEVPENRRQSSMQQAQETKRGSSMKQAQETKRQSSMQAVPENKRQPSMQQVPEAVQTQTPLEIVEQPKVHQKETTNKGLQLLAESDESIAKPVIKIQAKSVDSLKTGNKGLQMLAGSSQDLSNSQESTHKPVPKVQHVIQKLTEQSSHEDVHKQQRVNKLSRDQLTKFEASKSQEQLAKPQYASKVLRPMKSQDKLSKTKSQEQLMKTKSQEQLGDEPPKQVNSQRYEPKRQRAPSPRSVEVTSPQSPNVLTQEAQPVSQTATKELHESLTARATPRSRQPSEEPKIAPDADQHELPIGEGPKGWTWNGSKWVLEKDPKEQRQKPIAHVRNMSRVSRSSVESDNPLRKQSSKLARKYSSKVESELLQSLESPDTLLTQNPVNNPQQSDTPQSVNAVPTIESQASRPRDALSSPSASRAPSVTRDLKLTIGQEAERRSSKRTTRKFISLTEQELVASLESPNDAQKVPRTASQTEAIESPRTAVPKRRIDRHKSEFEEQMLKALQESRS